MPSEDEHVYDPQLGRIISRLKQTAQQLHQEENQLNLSHAPLCRIDHDAYRCTLGVSRYSDACEVCAGL